ncbi:MAG TPA: hypothetical protein VJ840_07240 [Gemmatimonadaceae bacterium]|nr:hypothetical protein [Gemmatimonadaceae bacterium]
MRQTSKSYAALVGALFVVCPAATRAQVGASDTDRQTCAAILSNDSSSGVRVGPGVGDSAARRDTTTRPRADSVSFGIGGARTGNPTIHLLVGVHADEVRFATQPHVRVRLCWGGDTLRVVQRENIPSPVVAGTTYRNVYVAVELIGRLNAECLSNAIGVGNPQQRPGAPAAGAAASAAAQVSAGNCAFLGGTAGAGQGVPRPPSP